MTDTTPSGRVKLKGPLATYRAPQCATGLPNRSFYEDEKRGWADGRLGQAFDLIDAACSEQHPESEARHMLNALCSRVEGADIEMGATQS